MFTIFGLDTKPCKNYQTFMKGILGSLNKILGFLPFIKIISEASNIPQFIFLEFKHDARMLMLLITNKFWGCDNNTEGTEEEDW